MSPWMLAAFGDELDKLGGAPVAVRDMQRLFAHPVPYETKSPPSKKLLAAVGSGAAVLGYGIGRAHSAYKHKKETADLRRQHTQMLDEITRRNSVAERNRAIEQGLIPKEAQMYPADLAKGTKAKPKETPRPGGQGLPRLGSGKPEGGGSATPFSGNKMKMASIEKEALSPELKNRAYTKASEDNIALRKAGRAVSGPAARRIRQMNVFSGEDRKPQTFQASARETRDAVHNARSVSDLDDFMSGRKPAAIPQPKPSTSHPHPTPPVVSAGKPGLLRPRNLAIGAGAAALAVTGAAYHKHKVDQRNAALKAKQEQEESEKAEKGASHELDTLIGAGALTGTALAVRKAYQRAEDEVHETARRKSLPLHVARGAGSALRSRLG